MTDGWLATAIARVEADTPSPAIEDQLDLAGHRILVRYPDSALADALGRATRHLAGAGAGTPGLTIDCWTEPGLELRLPEPRPPIGTLHVGGGSVVLTWDAPGGPLFAYDRAQRRGWALFGSVAAVPPWERATPFRRILGWWAADEGLQLVHAAAVGSPAGGVLLVGRSGSGKSTTALACLDAGLGFAGDDYCLLAPGDPTWVHGLYLSGKGDARTAELLPGLRESFACSSLVTNGKSVLFADEVRSDGLCPRFPLRGVVVPKLSREPISRLSPLRPAAALRALAPSTLLEMPGDRAGGLARLAAVVRELPAWELTVGPVPAAAADLLRDLIETELSE